MLDNVKHKVYNRDIINFMEVVDMKMTMSMTDRNGNVINSGDKVDIIMAGELKQKAIFKYTTSEDLAMIRELGIKFRKGGLQSYSTGCLAKYIYKENTQGVI